MRLTSSPGRKDQKMSSYKAVSNSSKGSPGSMARRKNNPFSRNNTSERLSSNKSLKVSRRSSDLDNPSMAHPEKVAALRSGSLRPRSGGVSYFNDPTQVDQWVESSASGGQPVIDNLYPLSGFDNALIGGPNQDLDTSGCSFPSHSSVSRVSLPYDVMASVPGCSLSYDEICKGGVEGTSSTGLDPALPRGFQMDMDMQMAGPPHYDASWPYVDSQAYSVPGGVDMMYTTSSSSHPVGNADNLDFSPPGFVAHPLRHEAIHGIDIPYTSGSLEWSNTTAVALNPSVSSSYSQGSQAALQSSSPHSSGIQEDVLSLDLNQIGDDEFNLLPSRMDGPVDTFPATGTLDAQSEIEMSSTVRPNQTTQRPSLTNLSWSGCETLAYPSVASPYENPFLQRRPSGESEVTSARQNELYSVGPKDDGLYHCPYEGGKGGCTHKPEKLKCNYDKHLDSHLKPYRCKVPSCGAVPFSSTACLLRHEREAHGMHGHGEKPYLCTYEECERSFPGNGFPRRWNLLDHMKRVHDYTGPPSSNGSSSPTPSSTGSQTKAANLVFRKRTPPSNATTIAPKRLKSISSTKVSSSKATSKPQTLSSAQGKQRQTMQKQWHEQHAAIQERLASLDPKDAFGLEQIGADYNILTTIGLNIRRLEAGQLANN